MSILPLAPPPALFTSLTGYSACVYVFTLIPTMCAEYMLVHVFKAMRASGCVQSFEQQSRGLNFKTPGPKTSRFKIRDKLRPGILNL